MKRLLVGFVVLMVLLTGAVAGGAWWLLKTEEGLQFALRQAEQQLATEAAKPFSAGQAQGTFWDGFTLPELRWQQDGMLVELTDLELQARWALLWGRKLDVAHLRANTLRLVIPETEPDPEPFTLPERVDLPISVVLRELTIQTIDYNGLLISEVQGAASVQGGKLDVQALSLEVEETRLSAKAQTELAKPYSLQAELTAQRAMEGLELDAKLQLEGTAERLQATLAAKGVDEGNPARSQAVDAQAVITPFSGGLLETLSLDAREFNPKMWASAAPRALLNIQAEIKPNEDFTHSLGKITVRNAAPETLHAGGLPVAQFDADFDLTLNEQLPGQLVLNIPELRLADRNRAAGTVSLKLEWQAAASAAPAEPAEAAAFDPLAGDAQFTVAARNLDPSVFAVLPTRLQLNANLKGSKQGDTVALQQIDLRERKARINGRASLGLTGEQPVDVLLNISEVNPADYIANAAPALRGTINGNVRANGKLAVGGQGFAPQGSATVSVDDSTLGRAPFTLNAQATGDGQRLSNLSLDLDVVGNTVNAKGAYGLADDRIALDVNLGQMERLGRLLDLKLGGSATLQATIEGAGLQTAASGELQINKLALDDALRIDSIAGDFNLGASPDSPWTAKLVAKKIEQPTAPQPLLNDATINLNGTRSNHELSLAVNSGLRPFSRSRPLRAAMALRGGVVPIARLNNESGWQGELTNMKFEGLWLPARSLTLEGAAPVTLGPGLVEVGRFALKGEDVSRIQNELVRLQGDEIIVEGEMPTFSFPRLSTIVRRQLSVEPSELVLNVNWSYRETPQKVAGKLDINHLSGGFQILDDSLTEVPVQTFTGNLDFNREGILLDLLIAAEGFGDVTANIRVPVVKNPATESYGPAMNEPLQGSIAAGFTDLNWLGPLITPGVKTSGSGQVAIAMGGTLAKPDVQGRLFALGLEVFQLDQGVRLEDGTVIVDFTTDKARIDQFEFTVYNRVVPRRNIEQLGPLIQGVGKINASGQWNLSGLDGEIIAKVDRAPLLQRPDRWLMANANVQVQQPKTQGQPIRVRGTFDALGGYFEMPETGSVPTLSDDVFIQGRSEVATQGDPVDVRLQANLGKLLYVNAQGLRTRLEGGLNLVVQDGVGGSGERRSGRRLSATGTIQAVDGTYRAYGQDLTIERGVVNFQGPLENPGLNVRAVRKGVAVEAGVEVTGTAQRPTVTLVSDPAVPDSEKLSWMLIGRGTNSSDRDSVLLLTAATAIFGDSDDSATKRIANRLGIDDFALTSGSLTAADSRAVGSKVAIAPGADVSANVIGAEDPLLNQRIITLGKRLRENLYLSYDQSVTTAASIVKLHYQFTRQFSVIARTGSDSALDFLYQIAYD